MTQYNKNISLNNLEIGTYYLKADGSENIVTVSDNKAALYAEKAAEAATRSENAALRAEEAAKQSTNVKMEHLILLENTLRSEIDEKQDKDDYALKEELPVNISDLNNDLDFFPVAQTSRALLESLPVEDTSTNKILESDGEKLYWNDIDSILNSSTAITQKQISNCVLSTSQRIKYNLQGQEIIVKAGSVAIVPNGYEADGITRKFDEIILDEDLTYQRNALEDIMYFIGSGSIINDQILKSFCYSGENAPTIFQDGAYAVWYDTTNNVVKRTGDAGATWTTGYSLPVGIGNSGDFYQIFNGFGYIGSTFWADKNVKCLIPNGRNEDGTLNNIEVITDNILITTLDKTTNAVNYYVVLTSDKNLLGLTTYPINFDEQANIFSSESIATPCASIACIEISNGVISNLRKKQVFQVIDKNTPHVVETYVKDASWYRVWSDGWKEQGGIVNNGSATWSWVRTVNLLKSFSNINYTIVVTAFLEGGSGAISNLGAFNTKMKDQFQMVHNSKYAGDAYCQYIDWYACGY